MLQCSTDLPEGGPPLCVQGWQGGFKRGAVSLWYDHSIDYVVCEGAYHAEYCANWLSPYYIGIVNRTKSPLGSRLLRWVWELTLLLTHSSILLSLHPSLDRELHISYMVIVDISRWMIFAGDLLELSLFPIPGCGSSVHWGTWQPYGSGRMP